MQIFEGKKRVVPFGKITEGGRLVFPQNEVFIGREKKREQFMRWLTSLKSGGSILITGARGVGKTSFVKNTIGSMNINLYERLKLKGINVSWGDNFSILLIFILVSITVTLSYELLFFESSSLLTNVIVRSISIIPFLLMIYWGMMMRRAIKHINEMTNFEENKSLQEKKDLSLLYLHLCSFSTFLSLFGALILAKFCFIILLNILPINDSLQEFSLLLIIVVLLSCFLILNRLYINKKCHLRRELEKQLSYSIHPIVVSISILSTLIFLLYILNSEPGYRQTGNVVSVFNSSLCIFLIVLITLAYSFYHERGLIKTSVKSSNPLNKSNEQSNKRANYLSQWTLSSIILRHYAPTIHININLGFSDLNHSNIIFSMLIDLRNKYYEIFKSSNYGFVFVKRMIFFLLSLVLWSSFVNYNGLIGLDILDFMNTLSSDIEANSNLFISHHLFVQINSSFSLLDIIGVILIYLVLSIIFTRFGFSRSSKNIKMIDLLIDELASKRVNSKQGKIGFSFGSTTLDNSMVSSSEQEPLNSRLVETKLIWLLNRLKQSDTGWFISPGSLFTKPSPTIFFVFDELDKLHDHSDNHNKLHPNDKSRNFTENEAARAKQIYRLLSDMKNLISTAPAKFIFIAGRDMRDQWLADSNARDSFITSIFEQEIFIPSLLTDYFNVRNPRLSDNIAQYVNVYHNRANRKFETKQLRQQTRKSLFSENNEELLTEDYLIFNDIFYKSAENNEKALEQYSLIQNAQDQNQDKENNRFINDYISFLTYKSRGIPKQLKRLLLENIETVENCPIANDALIFRDSDISRVQFVSEVYYLIEIELGDYLVQADDKLATSIFYLSDFILKFNAHAFSWRHLFRLDELAHIHKLPELHYVFEKLVNHFTGFYLNKVLNGLYTFRFRSDISKEIAFLSKISDVDSASYNFTLDESGDLKDIYRRKIEDSTCLNADFRVGLAELFDLDREFEDARENYLEAIRIIDSNFSEKHLIEGSNPINQVFITPPQNSKILSKNIKWGIERLGLMLQIGLTYERDNKLSYAFTNYKDARNLSRLLFTNYLGDLNGNKKDAISNRYDVIKHVNILFQSFYAEIWILEKLHNGVDSSIDVLEKGLISIRQALPNSKQLKPQKGEGFSNSSTTNFCILKSQFHNKAGDLYFFKGKKGRAIQAIKNEYINRAKYHYRVSLHEIKMYLVRAYSGEVGTADFKFPDHISLALSLNLLDLGETFIASTNINEILSSKHNEVYSVQFKPYLQQVKGWVLCQANSQTESDLSLQIKINGINKNICDLTQLFGKKAKKRSRDLIKCPKILNDDDKLLAGFLISYVGIIELASAGYNEFASKEFHEQLHLILLVLYIGTLNNSPNSEVMTILASLAYELLSSSINSTLKSKCGLRPPSVLNSGKNKPRLRPEIQTSALACIFITGVMFQSSNSKCLESINQKMTDLYQQYFEVETEALSPKRVMSCLECLIAQNHYPVVNHLRGKSWLVYMYELIGDEGNEKRFDCFKSIVKVNRTFDAPFIFTFAEVGLVAMYIKKSSIQLSTNDRIWVNKVCEKMINNCESMTTMGKKYYEEIRNLYYLFDDFNDRRNHMGHTIQMFLLDYLKANMLDI